MIGREFRYDLLAAVAGMSRPDLRDALDSLVRSELVFCRGEPPDASVEIRWTRGKDEAALRFLLPDEPDRTAARLGLVQAVAFTIASGLHIFGVEPVEEMR